MPGERKQFLEPICAAVMKKNVSLKLRGNRRVGLASTIGEKVGPGTGGGTSGRLRSG